jgi:hypothetical protein
LIQGLNQIILKLVKVIWEPVLGLFELGVKGQLQRYHLLLHSPKAFLAFSAML